jgi:hypothetical protein
MYFSIFAGFIFLFNWTLSFIGCCLVSYQLSANECARVRVGRFVYLSTTGTYRIECRVKEMSRYFGEASSAPKSVQVTLRTRAFKFWAQKGINL